MEIEDIIVSKLSGEALTEEQAAQFAEWYSASGENREYYNSLLDVKTGLLRSAVAGKVDMPKAWNAVKPAKSRRMAGRVMKYAAIFLLPLFAAAGVYMLWNDKGAELAREVEPGRQQAVLMLASGEEIVLTGEHASLTGDGVSMTNDLSAGLSYDGLNTTDAARIMHKMIVPRGGEYILRLTDGTVVRLNSESSLKYPIAFTGGVREVELEGEAYFEVAHDTATPFVVRTRDYDVRVTGTEFNVRSYSGVGTATTLVEGGVRIETDGGVFDLRPGQQAVAGKDGIAVKDVDTGAFTAWKDGEFSFTSTRLDDIMEQLMRWYDLEVEFVDPETRGFHFYAGFSRTSPIGEILAVLEETNAVKFELKGNKLSITKKRK